MMEAEGFQVGTSGLALSFLLVASCLILLWMEKIRVEKDVLWSAVRCFVQVLALGYVIGWIFDTRQPLWWFVMMLGMAAVGARVSSRRAKGIRRPWLISFVAIFAGALLSLGVVFAFQIVKFEARFIIPLAGIVIGNATRLLSISLERLGSEVTGRRKEIEAILSLGACPKIAGHYVLRPAVKAALIPSIDGMKIIGLVQMPGAMLGMIMAGQSPFDAAKLQIVVVYLLLASNTATVLAGVKLAIRQYFNKAMQFQPPVNSTKS
jgi:putative ABC transport system permease protein